MQPQLEEEPTVGNQAVQHMKSEPASEQIVEPPLALDADVDVGAAALGSRRARMSHILLPTYKEVKREELRKAALGQTRDNISDATISKAEPAEDISLDRIPSAPGRVVHVLSDKEVQEAASQLTNSAVKIKKDSQFSWRIVTDRIRAVGLERHPIQLNDTTLSFMFNRHYLHDLYGGSFVDTFPRPERRKVHFHKLDDFMCLRLDYNPHAPVNPGDPGLLFTYRSADRLRKYATGLNRLFVRTQASPALWQYMGQYRLYQSECLTKDEFISQSPVVRKTWAKAVLKRTQSNDIAARVYLRKTHEREPSQREVSKMLDNKKQMKMAKTKLTWADVAAAYERGEEEIRVYAMKCVGYDVEFQRILARNYRFFTPPETKRKTGPSNATGAKASSKHKRRRSVSATPEPSEPEYDDDADGSEDNGEIIDLVNSAGESDVEVVQYRPKGTRSRAQAKRLKTE
ncbi:hypothetical protein EVJ58_g7860 [Rhodofomes roseus]|uniref:DUF6697 domain-containing protein n=1 Tax=Rhodofomes roseus TaxID=34475 RepID=A0A4Y9Y3B1_9APHY|nr:hypothetical protein EVJ58_g7860 [Rhodofomes roseus]